MVISIVGLAAGVIMLVVGATMLGLRGEFESEQAGRSSGSGLWRSVRRGFSLYAEKETAEVVRMIREGKLSEALPWALIMLATFALVFFLPALIGHLARWEGIVPWLVGGFFLVATLFAAFPRSR